MAGSAPQPKWWMRAMGVAKLIRFAFLLSFAGAFAWLAYVRGGWLWAASAAIFAVLALFTLRLR
jgi:hypothetical protein